MTSVRTRLHPRREAAQSAYRRRSMARRSVVPVNTGHGKGKSSAAFGVMGRAWARGWRVGVVQFVKGGKWNTRELT